MASSSVVRSMTLCSSSSLSLRISSSARLRSVMSRWISRIAAIRSALVASERLAAGHNNGRPLPCDMRQLALPFSPLLESNVDSFPRDGEPGLQKLVGTPADCFLRSPAVGVLCPLIPEDDPAFRVAHQNCVVCQAQQRRLFPYFLLCRFTFRDVLDFNDRTDRYAVAKHRAGPIPHWEKGAVFAHEKVLAAHGFLHPYRPAQRAFVQRVGPS